MTMKKPTNCIDCPYHKVVNDPDPSDWFNDDDMAVVCTKTKNRSKKGNRVADSNEYRSITTMCRPYNLRKESTTPKWCPL